MMISAPEKTISNLENASGSRVLSMIPAVYHGSPLLNFRTC